MSENKKAHPAAATAEQAKGTDLTAKFPYTDFITHRKENLPVSDLLNEGAENALTLRDLMKLTGEDGRTIRRRIQQERLSGNPILSDNRSGYFLPQSEAEKACFVRNMRHRAKKILNAADSVERAL